MPFGLDIFRRGKSQGSGQPGPAARAPSLDEMVSHWDKLTGRSQLPQMIPAWALRLRVPYDPRPPVRSFLGGMPKAPERFVWPRDAQDRPLWFAGQIDLSEVRPEPVTGAMPPGLPHKGTLLLFFGHGARCALIDAHDMAAARDLAPPADLDPLTEAGFMIEDATFPRWSVDIEPFLDKVRHDDSFPLDREPPFDPAAELFTWADAALEARTVVRKLRLCLSRDRDHLERKLSTPPRNASEAQRLERDRDALTRTLEILRTEAPALERRLQAWSITCEKGQPGAPVDHAALGAIFAERRALADRMTSLTTTAAFRGRRDDIFMDLRRAFPAADADASGRRDLTAVPPEHRDYVRAYVSRWRGHTLFGQGIVRSDLGHDLRGVDPVFTIRTDTLLGTLTDHDAGFSGWFNRADIASARLGDGRLIRHDMG
jgi:hypothetical protein